MEANYMGLFIEKHNEYKLYQHSQHNNGTLPVKVKNPHITFKLHPKKPIPNEVLGRVFYVKVTGYGNDGRVQGFRAEIPEEVKEYYENDQIPHITVSKVEDAKPVETGKIVFEEIKSFLIKCRMGYFTNQGTCFTNI